MRKIQKISVWLIGVIIICGISGGYLLKVNGDLKPFYQYVKDIFQTDTKDSMPLKTDPAPLKTDPDKLPLVVPQHNVKRNYLPFHQEALDFSKSNGLNEDYYILIDMTIHSGMNRLFLYDFKTDKINHKALVTHGICDVLSPNPDPHTNVRFSNENNSHCSSLGKYKIGKRDVSGWGIKIKYWLEGLEKSNNNAKQRIVVLHSWEAVDNEESYPFYSPLSWGCPAVSNAFLKLLDEKLKRARKPTLLWIIG